ncbi:hypothetical protein HK101_008970 [Irineochytrium annulatum]|nr:hypothetical protein HK101_008970 [Irineochytrium annulatum]
MDVAMEHAIERSRSAKMSFSVWPTWEDCKDYHMLPEVLILDSSFNPPTKAHEAMITIAHATIASSEFVRTASTLSCEPAVTRNLPIILMLSINNADKGEIKEAAHKRLSMIHRLAVGLHKTIQVGDIIVACTTEARFVDKALAFQSVFPRTSLRFIVGYDTLIRLFDPKYYAGTVSAALTPLFDPMMGNASLIVFDRLKGKGDRSELDEFLSERETKFLVDEGKIRVIEAPEKSQEV